MNDKIINEFEAYLSRFKVKSIRLTRSESELQIACSLLTFKVLIDLALVAAVTIGVYLMPDRYSDLVFIVLSYAVVIGILWADFNSINIIKIELIDRKIEIISRNIIKQAISKYILKRENQFPFTDISSFTVRSNESFDTSLKKYFIDLKSGEKTTKAILNFRNEGETHTTVAFLTDIIRN
jgi:hypothetical protein